MPRLLVSVGQRRFTRRILSQLINLWITQGEAAMYDLQNLSLPAIFQTLKILSGPTRCFRGAFRVPFDFDNDPRFSEYAIRSLLRFEKSDLFELAQALGIPTMFRTSAGDVCYWQEAVVTLLYRLSFPNTWDRNQLFLCGRDRTASTRIFYYMVEKCYSFKHKLNDINIWREHMDTFTGVIAATGGVVPGVFGFIDGTFSGICRPGGGLGSASSGGLQRECYNTHYAGHGLKYQAVILPNGMFGDLYGEPQPLPDQVQLLLEQLRLWQAAAAA
jgi:hypothetical protein